ncbi:hypothetical protein [Nodosilinea nodulosa]|uniref:hypothetical protein n=1 Tax=Nodosilinea nodulosa TaxID=416001 RepID=UPI0002FC5834|nr:hypothetical protein [Nodosilinea nodulosa]
MKNRLIGGAIALGLPLVSLALAGPATAAALAQATPQQADLQRQRAALLYNQGNLIAAAALLEPALATYEGGGDSSSIQQTAAFLGLVYGELGNRAEAGRDLAMALDYYQQQIAALAAGFNRFAQAQAYVNAGRVAQRQGAAPLAQDYLTKGLDLAEQVGNPGLIRQAQDLLAAPRSPG